MNYLISNTSTVIIVSLIIYGVTALFLLPAPFKNQFISPEGTSKKALQFASRLIFRLMLIFPMLFLLKNAV